MKKLIFSIITLILSLNSFAQFPGWEWARTAIGDADDYKIATDNFGNVYVCGIFIDSTLTFGPYTLFNVNSNNDQQCDVFVAKFDSTGKIIWAQSGGGIGLEECWGIAADNSGNVYITGEFYSTSVNFGTHVLYNTDTSGYSSDAYFVKYDSLGNILWAKDIGGNGFDKGICIATDKNENVYLVGNFTSPNIVFGIDTFNYIGFGNPNLFIVKYDSTGNIIWAIRNNTDYGISFPNITTDKDGNFFLAGDYGQKIIFGTGTLKSTNVDFDLFLAKYNSSGQVIWAKSSHGIGGGAYVFSITSDMSRNIIMTGSFEAKKISFGSDTLINATNIGQYDDIYIVKYDQSGNVLWAHGMGGPGLEQGNSVASDFEENIYLVGEFAFGYESPFIVFDTITLWNPGGGDGIFIVKYNSSGHALWAKGYPCGGEDGEAIVISPTGSVYLGGDFICSSWVLGPDTLKTTGTSTQGIESVYVAKLISPPPINIPIIQQVNSNLANSIYFNSTLQINSDLPGKVTVVIYDVLGQKVTNIESYIHSINLNNLEFSSGVYFYRAYIGTEFISAGKFVVEK